MLRKRTTSGSCGAAEYSGEKVVDVQIAVEESGLPWTPRTVALLLGSVHDDECEICVGTTAEILEAGKRHGLPPSGLATATAGCVRFVIRGASGDWCSGPLLPRQAK